MNKTDSSRRCEDCQLPTKTIQLEAKSSQCILSQSRCFLLAPSPADRWLAAHPLPRASCTICGAVGGRWDHVCKAHGVMLGSPAMSCRPYVNHNSRSPRVHLTLSYFSFHVITFHLVHGLSASLPLKFGIPYLFTSGNHNHSPLSDVI